LFQTTCEGKNLIYLGSHTNSITAGAIAFDEPQAIIATFGEFVERYCPSFQDREKYNLQINKSYDDLKNLGLNVLDLKFLKPYKDNQYSPTFPYKKITSSEKIDWVMAYCHISEKDIFVPCEQVFLPYKSYDTKFKYFSQTSTGLAAHTSTLNAIKNGYFECEERNAFSKWWYLQKDETYKQIKYTQKEVLKKYSHNEKLKSLYDNDNVEIITYDLGKFSNIETIVCFMKFRYKEIEYISIGCSSRISKDEAIIKAALEAYQGVDYVLLLCKRKNWLTDHDKDFNLVNAFDKHFAFYNYFPEFREKAPIMKNLIEGKEYSEIVDFPDKIKEFSIEEIKQNHKDLPHVISIDLTTSDVESLGFEVHRVILPGFHMLTGSHEMQFLGLFDENTDELFTEYPHPFP